MTSRLATVLLTLLAALLAAAPAHAAPRPDVSVTSVGDPPSAPQPGSRFTVLTRVANRGTATAAASRLGIFVSKDRTLGASDVLLGEAALRPLRAGRAVLLTRRVTLPKGLPDGRYVLLVCADRGRTVAESQEANNCRSSAARFTVKAPEVKVVPTTVTTTTTVTTPAPPPPAPAEPVTTAPAAPKLAGTVPAGIGADDSPLVTGTAEPGARVRVYLTDTCTGPVAAATTADTDGTFAAGVPVPQDKVSKLAATARDAAGNTSACSTAIQYEQDATTPAAPLVASSQPASPAPVRNPVISGTAEPSTIVTFYLGVACNGGVVGQTVADVNGAWSITLLLADNDTTNVTATATDPAGHISLCATPLAYRHDDTPPATATITSINPGATGSNPTPTLLGKAEPGGTVQVYKSATCTGAVVASTTALGNGDWNAPVAAGLNTSTTWSAKVRDAAGNVSEQCSSSRSYVHDDIAPAVPAFDSPAFTPASPSPNATPVVSGTGDPGSLVRLYAGTGCTGPATSIRVDGTGAWSLELFFDNPDAEDVTVTYAIRGLDDAGNFTGCAPGEASYRHDNTAPKITSVTWPSSPSKDTTFTVAGHTDEAGGTVFVVGTANPPVLCNSAGQIIGSGTADGDGDFSFSVSLPRVVPVIPPEDGDYKLAVGVRDEATNLSNCPEKTYTLDTRADPPQINNPVSPGSDPLPVFGGSAEPGALVQVFEGEDCTGALVGQTTADESGGWGEIHTTTPAAGTTHYSAKQVDVAGNTSSCTPYDYVLDTTAPAVPSLVDTVPATQGGPSPYVRGTADNDSTVTLYDSADCSPGTEIGSGPGGSAFAYPGVQVFISSDPSSGFISATASDQVGNRSACSTAIAYTVLP